MQRLWIPAFAGMTEYRTDPPRHSRADGNPVGWLKGTYYPEMRLPWIPAFAGMTRGGVSR
jgi:hypothetical protein